MYLCVFILQRGDNAGDERARLGGDGAVQRRQHAPPAAAQHEHEHGLQPSLQRRVRAPRVQALRLQEEPQRGPQQPQHDRRQGHDVSFMLK
jgi:hypothetical protein